MRLHVRKDNADNAKGREKNIWINQKEKYVTYLKLGASTQQHIKSLQMILIGENLNYAIHKVELCKLIFAIDNLSKGKHME